MIKKETNILYFGFDESNHAGPNRKGEIVVATYSKSHEDSIVKEWPNRRTYSIVEKWLKQEGNDFKFTLLTGEEYKYRNSAANLTEATPGLVLSVLTEPFFPEINCIKLYFDGGGFGREQKKFLRGYFKEFGLSDVVADNFIKKNRNKKGKIRKGPRCPKLVYLSDILANYLDRLSVGELLSHSKFIP